jgi:glyoxylase-like metal-dependent hydrolase (beta-lactamase superfamily II)
MAPESDAADIRALTLPSGLEYFPLKGHFFDMIGVRTPDGVVFLSDCLFGQNTIENIISHLFTTWENLSVRLSPSHR